MPNPPDITTAPPSDGTATTWRDLTDQLTPEQITQLEEWEIGDGSEIVDPSKRWTANERAHWLLVIARDLFAPYNARVQSL